MASVGGYNLKKYKTTRGREGIGYTTELHKGTTLIARLEDYATGGGVGVFFDRDLPDFDMVLNDMRSLLSSLVMVIEHDALCESFANNPYSAAEGFTEILIGLKELEKQANKANKLTEQGCYYFVGSFGTSWFKQMGDSLYPSVSFYYCTQTNDYARAEELAKAYASRNKEKHGQLVELAILTGKFDWNLSFEDFASLQTP